MRTTWIWASIGLVLSSCATEHPPYPAAGRRTGCTDHGAIDGEFTGIATGCLEYPNGYVEGRFGDLYVAFKDGRLRALNDWHLRNDAPAEPDMYNLFVLGTDVGQFEIKVFGDQHVEVRRNGMPYTDGAEGAAGFGPTARHADPHTLFEFALNADIHDATWVQHDPGSGTYPDAESALVQEPTIFTLSVGPDGRTSVGKLDEGAPALWATEPAVGVVGQTVRLIGANLGARGTVRFGSRSAEVVSWTPTAIDVRVPVVTGNVLVSATTEHGEAGPVLFVASCTPTCGSRVCGDDGCGGSCGACRSGQRCMEGRCECEPSCGGRVCGFDGCGGTCGTCPLGTSCNGASCVCTPQCSGKTCGDDGCGGSCGDCGAQKQCVDFRCVSL